tara:strand:- start:115 stop:750 length:636 start_codon:yes stop_codon:yes gene_type:complete
MNEKDLRHLIAEQLAQMISEQEAEETPEADEPDAPSGASVDEQIDALLLQYEKMSLPSEEEMIREVLDTKSLKFILEQEEATDEEEEETEEIEVAAADEEAEEEDPDEEEEVAEEDLVAENPVLDVATFALKVARLAEVPEKVLDLKDAIINRAIQYISSNYDEIVAKEVEQTLMDNYQLALPEEEVEKVVASDLPAPAAVGAGPGGGAGG